MIFPRARLSNGARPLADHQKIGITGSTNVSRDISGQKMLFPIVALGESIIEVGGTAGLVTAAVIVALSPAASLPPAVVALISLVTVVALLNIIEYASVERAKQNSDQVSPGPTSPPALPDVSDGRVKRLPIVTSTANRPTHCSEDPQDSSDNDQDHTDRPQDRDVEQVAQQ